METAAIKHYCPCCGFADLSAPAYRLLGSPPWPNHGPPPYELRYGLPSYDVCYCCGFEFGNDDNPGTSAPVTFEAYRATWIADGCPWFDASKRPSGWLADEQMSAAGIS